MNFNFQKARELMVENQLRPNKINNPTILGLFKNIKKEDFLPEQIKKNSYNDLDTQLSSNRGYLKNLHVAQLIHNAEINKQDKILHIGGMTGYVSVILSSLCKELIIIENDINLISKIGGIILLVTGVLILTNQLQVIGFYIIKVFPFMQNFG